jgi:hypothetical protein
VTDKPDYLSVASWGGCKASDDPPCDDGEDFDALLAAASSISEQGRMICGLTPPAAREHARRVLAGEETCAPVDGNIDDAVSGLAHGLAHGVVPGPTVLPLEGFTLKTSDLAALQQDRRLVVIVACQSNVLWPDHRARLLQALIDHDALTDLRPDVARAIIALTLDVPRPPQVLLRCAEQAAGQIDVSASALAWLTHGDPADKAGKHTLELALPWDKAVTAPERTGPQQTQSIVHTLLAHPAPTGEPTATTAKAKCSIECIVQNDRMAGVVSLVKPPRRLSDHSTKCAVAAGTAGTATTTVGAILGASAAAEVAATLGVLLVLVMMLCLVSVPNRPIRAARVLRVLRRRSTYQDPL